MPGDTAIGWTHVKLPQPDGTIKAYRGVSWNPWTGCRKVSPGCDFCYAETFAERFRGKVTGHPYEQGFDFKLWPARFELPLHWRQPRGIFVNSMSDLFLEEVEDTHIFAIFRTMCRANWHIYQILTKRAPRMVRMVPALTSLIEEETGSSVWPSHVWMGVTVESSKQGGRIPLLRKVPSAVRFISYEPAIGPLYASLHDIDWLIVGSESGHPEKIRPMDRKWVWDALGECRRQGTAFFYKQETNPATGKKITSPTLAGVAYEEYPIPKQRGG